ncbi:metal ABC transporter solute-binding protein, Zn/Mn family [Neochlamydia sp. S13]|uniref:metal ABC transporter solute-binding protein, Zn/Mn family n=1 Tax=Neochlamydia sp. S13 TaxID=1353976 RepID=UPI0005A5EEE2|nr:zinc ABC transporter substrate-binding protein [Neochlamydia sp. S13]BBI16379.1 Uncharacterized metal-binding lipoprotein [Neochlamydia sp. S13]
MKSWLQMGIWMSVFLMVACTSEDQHRRIEREGFGLKNGKIKALSTIAMIGDIVQQVGGEHVDNLTLMRGDLDPHTYQLVKGDDEKLAYADVVFYNGLGLEHGPSLQRFLESNKKAVGLGNKIIKDYPSLVIYSQGQIDPHIWMDMAIWAKIIPYIVEVLSINDPMHAEVFHANGEKLMQDLLQSDQEIKYELGLIPSEKRYLVTSHDAFNYFARAYLATQEERINGKWVQRVASPEGLAPESQLSTSHIQEIIDYLSKHRIQVIFPESNVSKDSLRKIISAGKEKGLNITIAPCCLYADAMGAAGSSGETYQKMIQHDADWIKKCLKVDG